MSNNRTILLRKATKSKLKASGNEINLHVLFRGGNPGVVDQTGQVFIETKKKFVKKDVRSIFQDSNTLNDVNTKVKVKDTHVQRTAISDETFKDPNIDDWTDWDVGFLYR